MLRIVWTYKEHVRLVVGRVEQGDRIRLGKPGEEEEVGGLMKGVVGVGVPHHLGGGRDHGDVGSDVLHELGAALFELIHEADSMGVVCDKH